MLWLVPIVLRLVSVVLWLFPIVLQLVSVVLRLVSVRMQLVSAACVAACFRCVCCGLFPLRVLRLVSVVLC